MSWKVFFFIDTNSLWGNTDKINCFLTTASFAKTFTITKFISGRTWGRETMNLASGPPASRVRSTESTARWLSTRTRTKNTAAMGAVSAAIITVTTTTTISTEATATLETQMAVAPTGRKGTLQDQDTNNFFIRKFNFNFFNFFIQLTFLYRMLIFFLSSFYYFYCINFKDY